MHCRLDLDERQSRLLRERWLWHVPLKAADPLDLRRYHPSYLEMLDHPSDDEYWSRFDIARRHAEVEVPALHVSGWYDTPVAGTIRNFAGLRDGARTEHARRSQRLIVGPWTHARPRPDATRIGDLGFGPSAGLDFDALLVDWSTCRLKSAHPPEACQGSPVRLFVMGENVWRDEPAWPLARARPTSYYLDSGGRANTLDGDGRLSTTPTAGDTPDRFVHDPWDPVPTGASGGYSRSPADQRTIESRPDVLVLSTPPLDRAVEVTGPGTWSSGWRRPLPTRTSRGSWSTCGCGSTLA
jgi:hypothetical protein